MRLSTRTIKPRIHKAPTAQAWRNAPLSMFMATCAGVGHLPGGPGTYAAILATPLIVWMSTWSFAWRLGPFLLVTLLSIVWAHRAGRALGEHDSGHIVIDEVVGVWAALVLFPHLDWLAALVGLLLFRVADILKPPPARRIDDTGRGGLSVIADDLIAGLWVIPAVWLTRWIAATLT